MNRVLLLALAALLAVAAWLVFAPGDPRLQHAPPTQGEGTTPGAGDLQGEDPGTAAPTNGRQRLSGDSPGGQGEPEAYRRALSGIHGRLVWRSSRQPIAGVEIKLGEAWLDAIVPRFEDVAGMAEMRSPVLFRASARTDEDGVFQLRGVHSRALLFLAIGLQTDKAALRLIDHSPLPGQSLDLGDIGLWERGSVRGRVLDVAGKPVADAQVRVADLPKIAFQFGLEHFDPQGMVLWVQGPYRVVMQLPRWLAGYDEIVPVGRAVTDAAGNFLVRGVRPGKPSLVIRKPDLAPIRRDIDVASEQQTELGDLQMGDGEFLSGRFVDAEGRPVGGVAVAAGGANSMIPIGLIKRPREVGADGRFELAGLPRSSLYLLYRRKPKMPWEVSGPHRGDDEVEIQLAPLATGTVRMFERLAGGGERPYPGKVEFSFCVADESSYMPGFERMLPGAAHFRRSRKPGQEHVWQVRDLPRGRYRVLARAEGFVLASGVLRLAKQSAEERSTAIHLSPAPRLEFLVTDAEERPIEAARIYWNDVKPQQERTYKDISRLPMILGKTDAEGRLVTDKVPATATRFYARHPEFALGFNPEVPARQPIRIVLGRSGSLAGILAADGQAPEQTHTIIAEPSGELRRKFAGVLVPSFTHTAPDGSFRFANLQPGRWRLRAIPSLGELSSFDEMFRLARSRAGVGPPADADVSPEAQAFVRLELHGAAEAKGAGSLVGSVRVNGIPAKGAWVQTWAGRQQADVGADGNFALRGLADGELWISVERPGAEGMLPNRLWEGRVLIQDGSQETLHIDVSAADVTVRVRSGADGQPVSGLLLVLVGKAQETSGHRGQTRIAVGTDSEGVASFAAVPHGQYVVRSAMQRQAEVVLPDHPVAVFQPQVELQATARAPAVAAGTLRYDLSGLRDEIERRYARERRPRYLVFENDRRFIWGPVTERDGQSHFRMRPGVPGAFTLQHRGKGLRWTSSVLQVPPEGTDRAEVVLRPDPAQVAAAVAPLRPEQGDGTRQGK